METTVLEKIQNQKKVFFKSDSLEIYTREFSNSPIITIFAKNSSEDNGEDSGKGFGIEIEIYPVLLRINLYSINSFAPFCATINEIELDEITSKKLAYAYKTNAITKLLKIVSDIREVNVGVRSFLNMVISEIT